MAGYTFTINFDTGIDKVEYSNSLNDFPYGEVTSSGQTVSGIELYVRPVFKQGYELDSTNVVPTNTNGIYTCKKDTIVVITNVTFTSKQSTPQPTLTFKPFYDAGTIGTGTYKFRHYSQEKPSTGHTLTFDSVVEAKVNGTIVTSPYTLQNGDTIVLIDDTTYLIVNGVSYTTSGQTISLSDTDIVVERGSRLPGGFSLTINYTAGGATLGSLAIGSKIKISHSVLGDIIFLKADKDHDGYPSNSTTLITEKIILLRAFDAKEPNNSDANRKSYGNNKYSVSNLDQWLNSSAAAGQWYSARHSADQAPNNANVWNNYNEYDQDAGFLAGFDAAFVAALKDTTLKVALNTVTDGGGYESVTRKFFLPSRAELFGAAENSIMEGSLLSYFSANTNDIRKAQISAYAAAHSEYSVTAGRNWYYWLRTHLSSSSYNVRTVFSDGSLDNYSAYYGSVGVRPLCNLDSGISVSDSTDSDGCYTLNLGGGQ